jgi:hypothetical protein
MIPSIRSFKPIVHCNLTVGAERISSSGEHNRCAAAVVT